ncbi:hemagglutinin repeat-containing protein [Stenotrophomonas maltophilia]|uniref:hemagglutinin repeat-containing protein n=1 Tax=Stenotrophomonas maltophilia TaxID=40324 RepID=UPI0021C818E4|nr:hemagglutinin repeat-containing protein [Stenotrophomonas maltophilia]
MVTAGSQRANSEQSHSTSDARVSQLAAGGDLTLIANGGSILSQGTQMSAEGNAVLLATKDIVFDVAHNTERSDSSSRGKGWALPTTPAACRSVPTTRRARAAAAVTPSPARSCRSAAACAWPPPRATSA